MILHIGNNPNLTTPPTTAFNVTGILDQESTEASNQNGYTLWLKARFAKALMCKS